MSTNELATKIREMKELQAMADELQNEITAIQNRVKAEMTTRDVEEMIVDVFKVRWMTYTTKRFDMMTFKAMHSELYAKDTKAIENRRFSNIQPLIEPSTIPLWIWFCSSR